jgi:hypothetical protein
MFVQVSALNAQLPHQRTTHRLAISEIKLPWHGQFHLRSTMRLPSRDFLLLNKYLRTRERCVSNAVAGRLVVNCQT